MKNFLKNKKVLNTIRIIAGIVLVILAVLLLYDARHISIENILSIPPKNSLISALIVFLLYALKSITVFIPLVALQLIAGSMFDTAPAILINFIGIIICYSIPYYIGKRTGHNEESKVLAKFPRLEKFLNHEERGVFFPSVFLRLIGFLPTDLVSLYLGTFSSSYFKYISGSLLGSAIRIVAVSVLGANLDNIASPQFISSVIIIVILTVLSCLGYIFYQRKREE